MLYDAEWWKKLKWRAILAGWWAGKIWPQTARPLTGLWTCDLKESNSWAKMSPNMRELFTVCTRVHNSWIEVNSCRKKSILGPKFVFPSCIQICAHEDISYLLASHTRCNCMLLYLTSCFISTLKWFFSAVEYSRRFADQTADASWGWYIGYKDHHL